MIPVDICSKIKMSQSNSGEGTNPLRHHELGLFLIGMIKKMVLICKDYHTIVCEAQKGDQQKAFFFYKKLVFIHILSNHPQVEYFRLRHASLFHDDKGCLEWLVSSCPVYSTNPELLYSDRKKTVDTKKAITFAKDNLLCNFEESNATLNSLYRRQKFLREVISSKLVVSITSFDRKPRTRNDAKRSASLSELHAILAKINATSKSTTKLRMLSANQNDHSSWECLSVFFTGKQNNFQEVRNLFSYIFKCLFAFDESADHFKYQTVKFSQESNRYCKSIQQFQEDAVKAYFRKDNCFKDEQFRTGYKVFGETELLYDDEKNC